MQNTFACVEGRGLHAVTLTSRLIGEDVMVSLFGGVRPHIGAVALASPCSSIQAGVHAFASVLTAPGHRDDTVAHRLALGLCKAFGRTVCVTVGLHMDNASAEDISMLLRNAEAAAERLKTTIQEHCDGSERLFEKA